MLNLRTLSTTQGVLILCLYECRKQGALSEDEFIESLKLVECYLLRHAIFSLVRKNYWSNFTNAAHDICSKNKFQSIKLAFALRRDSHRFSLTMNFFVDFKNSTLIILKFVNTSLIDSRKTDRKSQVLFIHMQKNSLCPKRLTMCPSGNTC